MDTRNDFIRLVDADGTEHHLNLATVVDVAFDREGVATIFTTPRSPSTEGGHHTVVSAEAERLRVALARREDWVVAPVAGHLPEFRQSPTRPRPL